MMVISNTQTLRIGIVAGEASGDALGRHLIHALKLRYPHAEFVGVAGSKMLAEGCVGIFEQEHLAVRGFVEVLHKLPKILRLRQKLLSYYADNPPDIFIGIDAPDFNLGVERRLKEMGVPIVHYVSPSVWAWRADRVQKMVQFIDLVLCLFPMEPEIYQQAGGDAEYIGHPLAQKLPMEPDRLMMRKEMQIAPDVPVFTLMPGSRVSEIYYLAKSFFQAAELLHQRYPNAVFLLPSATEATTHHLVKEIRKNAFAKKHILLLDGRAQQAVIASDVVLVASGTATLEVALCKRPMVIAYRIAKTTHYWVKRFFQSPYVGLPNILLNDFVVPELLQKDANGRKLAAAMADWYESPDKVRTLTAQFRELHETLMCDTATLAASAVIRVLEQNQQDNQNIKE